MATETIENVSETHSKEWFLARIGQRVFRYSNGCDCESCKSTEKKGLVINSRDQATYLFDIQNEVGINYFQK